MVVTDGTAYAGIGRDLPRLETGGESDGTLEHSVYAAAKEINVNLDRWQRYCVSRIFRTKGSRLAVRTALVSVARQNGKTTLALVIIYWWLTRQPFGRDVTILVSHDLRITSRMFDRVVAHLNDKGWLDDDKRRRAVSYSFGRQTAKLVNGSELVVQADTPSAGHGWDRVGLLYGDEIWAVRPEAWDHGLLPTQRVHPSPLALMVSTAGDESSTLFKKWRDLGLFRIDRKIDSNFCMLEWSIPPGLDPMDERHWGWSNPALGDRLSLETLRDESEAPDRPAFLRASLNMWISSAQSWLSPGLWEQTRRELPPFEGGVLACEVSQDGERFVGVRAMRMEDATAVETAVHSDTEEQFWADVAALMADKKMTLAITPSLQLHLPEQYADRHVVVGFRELGQWTGLVRSLIHEGLVFHRGEQLLSEHINRAVSAKTESGMALSSARSPGPIEAARCSVWAVALVTVPPKPVRRPAVAAPSV